MQVEVFSKKWKEQALNMRDSSVFYLNKLTSASKILNKINRVAYFFSPNFTQNKKPIYHGLTQLDVKSTLMSFCKEILKSCTLWPRLKCKAYQGKCFAFYILLSLSYVCNIRFGFDRSR